MRMIRNVCRRFALAGVGVLACVSALAIASCTQVGDSITGVTLSRSSTSSCLGVCRTEYNDATSAERKRHQTQEEVCRSLPSDDRDPCLAAEDDLHRSIMDQLKGDLADCQNDCHRQGGGSGG